MPTHYDDHAGKPVAIETHVHLLSDHATAALTAGWRLRLRERVIDDAWIRLKPGWAPLRDNRSRSRSCGVVSPDDSNAYLDEHYVCRAQPSRS